MVKKQPFISLNYKGLLHFYADRTGLIFFLRISLNYSVMHYLQAFYKLRKTIRCINKCINVYNVVPFLAFYSYL